MEQRIKLWVLIGGASLVVACITFMGLKSGYTTMHQCVVDGWLQPPTPDETDGAERCHKVYCWTGEDAWDNASDAMEDRRYDGPRFFLSYYPSDEDGMVCVRRNERSYWRHFNEGLRR